MNGVKISLQNPTKNQKSVEISIFLQTVAYLSLSNHIYIKNHVFTNLFVPFISNFQVEINVISIGISQ